MPRTTTYTDSLASEICRRMAAGETLGAICRTEGMPARYTVLGWLLDSRFDQFHRQFAVAERSLWHRMACELADLRQEQVRRVQVAGRRARSQGQRAQLRIDALEWFLGAQQAWQPDSTADDAGRSLELGGTPESLSIADHLVAAGNGSLRPTAPSDAAPEAMAIVGPACGASQASTFPSTAVDRRVGGI